MSKAAQKWLGILRSGFKLIVIVVAIGGLGGFVAWMSGMFEDKIQPSEDGQLVRRFENQPTDMIHEIEQDYIEESVGTLKAASRSVISAKILATIQEMHVTAGDYVHQGDLLVSLNTQEFEVRVRQAGEVLQGAQAGTIEAKSDFERNRSLLAQNAISQREFDESNRKLKVAEAEERRAQEAINEANVLLSYATITAPKSGRIVDRSAEPGDTVQPGAPILTLYDSESLRLEAPVPEQLAVKLTMGQQLKVRIDSIDAEFMATVDEIVPQADSSSRSFLVKASLPRNDRLYEGMYGRLKIPAGSRKHLCLPTSAIRRVGQLEFVDVLLEDQTLQRRMIKTGRLGIPGRVEVLSGVTANETVILSEKVQQ